MGQDYIVQEVQKNVPFQEGNSACERTFFLGHMVHKGLFSHFEKLYFIKKKINYFLCFQHEHHNLVSIPALASLVQLLIQVSFNFE